MLQHTRYNGPLRVLLTAVLVGITLTGLYVSNPPRAAKAFSWLEGFDAGLPGTWVVTNRSWPRDFVNPVYWQTCSGTTIPPAFSGAPNSCLLVNYTSANGQGTISNWLITPLITTLKNNDVIRFYTRSNQGGTIAPDRLQVRISTAGTCNLSNAVNGPADATNVGDFTTLLVDVNPTYAESGYPSTWTQFSATLSGISGVVSGCIAFRYYVENAPPNASIIGLDDVEYVDITPPTATNTPTVTNTPFTPTITNTPVPPTITNTPGPTTPTNTPIPFITNTPTNTPLPGGPSTVGLYKNGIFYLRFSNNTGNPDITVAFGGDPTDLPVSGDWDGDSFDTIGIYRSSTGQYFLSNSNTSPTANFVITFGNPGDTPFAGKWTSAMLNDGVGVYRNSNGILYEKTQLTTGFSNYFAVFGNPGDIGFAGDWNGDNLDSIGVYRSSNTMWYMTNNSQPSGPIFSQINFIWNIGANRPVIGDWDGNNTSTTGYYNVSSGIFFLNNTNASPTALTSLSLGGITGAYPFAGRWKQTGAPSSGSVLVPGPSTFTNAEGGTGD